MTTITGLFKDSGNVALATGILRVQLNAPLPDTATTPDSYLLQLPADFAITAGALASCNLKESETANVSYTFSVLRTSNDYDYYYASDGSFYARNDERPSHLHTDSKYYTGLTHSGDSVELERIARPREEVIETFQAIVPNVASVEFAALERTGFATDRTPQTARQVARVLQEDPLFLQELIDFLVAAPYDNTLPYRRGNIVTVSGSAYQCVVDNVVGKPPAANPAEWTLLVSKGDPGGTGGNDTAYAPSWNGVTDAPSKNAVYDKIETLAPLASPTLTGTPAGPTAATATETTQLATTAYVANKITDRFAGAVLTSNPTAPDQDVAVALATNGSRIANCNFAKATHRRYARLIDSKTSGTAGGSSVVGIQTRDLTNIDVNTGSDVTSLSGNTFTLRAGTYRIQARARSHRVGTTRIFLWNNSDSTRVINGVSAYFESSTIVSGEATLSGEFTIASSKDFQIRQYCATAQASTGLGVAVTEASINEIYTVVELWRVD